MELLLNLAWFLLALPACWLWRSSRARSQHKFSSLQCLVALGCLLVMLFPVISVTDDLIAMRTEMEESPAGKRSMRQVNGEKTSTGPRFEPAPALAAMQSLAAPAAHISDVPSMQPESVPVQPVLVPAGRSPPDYRHA